MLNVKIVKSEPNKVTDVWLHENDIQLVKEVYHKIGYVQSIKVFRSMTKCSLLDAKNYVDDLMERYK